LRVIHVDDDRLDAVALSEGRESLCVMLRAAPVVQVVGLHIGDHGNLGGVLQKAAIRFIGLDDHDIPRAEQSTGAAGGQRSPHDIAGVDTGGVQHDCGHRGRRGLAMSASHRNHPPADHQ